MTLENIDDSDFTLIGFNEEEVAQGISIIDSMFRRYIFLSPNCRSREIQPINTLETEEKCILEVNNPPNIATTQIPGVALTNALHLNLKGKTQELVSPSSKLKMIMMIQPNQRRKERSTYMRTNLATLNLYPIMPSKILNCTDRLLRTNRKYVVMKNLRSSNLVQSPRMIWHSNK